MENIRVRVHNADTVMKKTDQLAWKIVAFATGDFSIDTDVAEMVSCRLIN